MMTNLTHWRDIDCQGDIQQALRLFSFAYAKLPTERRGPVHIGKADMATDGGRNRFYVRAGELSMCLYVHPVVEIESARTVLADYLRIRGHRVTVW